MAKRNSTKTATKEAIQASEPKLQVFNKWAGVSIQNKPIDWTGAWNRIVGKGKQALAGQVFQVSRELLKYYESELDYDLDDAEEFLEVRLGVSLS
jgi:hypothetical protein